MAEFIYKAKDKKGGDVSGLVEANDLKQARSILREKGYFAYHIKEKKPNFIISSFQKFLKKISLTEVATFTRQLATMINAGLPLTDALIILKSQSESKMAGIAGEILKDVEQGTTLGDSLKKHPKIFSPVYISLVRAGESAGVLDNIMLRLADNLEAQREFRSKIKGALTYPIIIIIGMGAVIFIMMVFVIPKLTALYTEFDAKLPKPTQVLMSASAFMVNFWWLVLAFIAGLFYLFKLIKKNKKGKRKIDELKFKLPIAGKLQKQVILAEFTRTLGLLIGAGVSIIEALEISAKTTNNQIIEEALAKANRQVEKGFPLATVIADNPVFPQILSQMLSVGEETGKVDEVLLKVSKFFQSESEESLKGLTSAIEPLIMILLGVGVGFLVIAIILPIYNLTSQFQ